MDNFDITIRHAQKSDLNELQTLFGETISVICKNDYSPEQIKVWTSSSANINRWIDKLEKQYFIIAEINNKIVGYASLENNSYLDFMYVHKDYQRQGIASRLYTQIEEEAIKEGTAILKSDVSITARPFFECKGFITILTQAKIIQGVEIVNYKMIKGIGNPLVNNKYLLEKFPGKGGWTYAAIPEVLQNKKSPFGWVKVKGIIDVYEIKNYRLMPMGNGQLFLPVKADIRKKIGKEEGDYVNVILFPDNSPTEIPEELLLCLLDDPNAHKTFLSYPDGEQKAFIDWIYAAKTDDTKIKRIAKTLDKLSKHQKFMEK